ncbi:MULTISPECIES: DUF424 domain-containing protein [unclassified Halobacterium]|jgi:hypothetical protein|uniref:DUF424 domain-containing protein n=1 Tax=unclassified Halobacterium TaxID=2668073 RepID=UPI001E4E6BE9|nr:MULTISPECIES: DUF424 family protein [unclassified Halobacterium]MCD2199055.1 DUF424 family protein [Halobacterium sp. KA-4]MCD2203078.1 DUF424 family protein [Halobacterium sp. KA-6]
MILSERQTDRGLLVTACDPDVLGETFANGDTEFTVNEEFYGGETVDPDAVRESLARANVANLVGVDVVDLAIEEGHVEEANVLDLDGTVHAQFMRL